jgi:hypothetical protein
VNWRAFLLGATAAAVLAVAALVVVRSDDDDPSLGDAAAATSPPERVAPPVIQDGLTTMPPIVPLAVDADALLGDACSVLTDGLRAAVGVEDVPRPSAPGRCVAGEGEDALEVELRAEPGDPSAASYEFQELYGEEPRPAGVIPITYRVRQRSRELVVVFATGVSAWFLLPVSDVDPSLLVSIRDALEP